MLNNSLNYLLQGVGGPPSISTSGGQRTLQLLILNQYLDSFIPQSFSTKTK
jgi:hypothetical protein